MARRSDLIKERNLKIIADFKRMVNVEKRQYVWTLEQLEAKYFLSRATIANICAGHIE